MDCKLHILTTALLFITVQAAPVFDSEEPEEELLFVQALWRHGDRAPAGKFSHKKQAQHFPYGLGQLTETGVENSYRLGELLKKRYIESGYLNSVLQQSEVFFRSPDHTRCLMSGVAVGQGMFSERGRRIPLPVAVHSKQAKHDPLLRPPWNCETMELIYRGRAPAMQPIGAFHDFHDIETEAFLHSSNGSEFFPSHADFSHIEPLLAESIANVSMPSWFTEEVEQQARILQFKALAFLIGLAEFHHAHLLSLHTGLLLDTMLRDMQGKWDCAAGAGDCQTRLQDLKFIGYSTQDFILASILESLGIREAAVGQNRMPAYCSCILIELWKIRGEPFVKVLYRKNSTDDSFYEVSGVRNCANSSPCPLSQFSSCCSDYKTSDHFAKCHGDAPPQHASLY